MIRLSITSLICLCLFASVSYAELPTRTLAQGGWFAIGGPVFSLPGSTVSTLCGGAPCTDANFANAFGHVFTGLIPSPGTAHYYDSRTKATEAVMNGEFSIHMGPLCQPGVDTGQPAILISGFAQYYTLRDFLYTQLAQPLGGLMPGAETRIMDFTGAITLELNNRGLGALAPTSSGPLVNRDDGQLFDNATFPMTLTLLDIRLYQQIAGWADRLGFVVNAFNVTNLKTNSFICP